ncbi:Predicted phosphohydrolase or phosphomutase, AlkP superfamily [Halopenitus malekzadehii]|uniref:Predicted phosphohydrolase or phosphomutase, AlkP superfamily n=1 Tax=Halopenitus malekzadehii TaxID=1267564 RepID=A0A1H6IIY0_9EURY|nr:alkaline phosphatase family protein [Halopenitus malekzadehii]SEH46291.1 Predicted phosphohydrolase or phosphomutase, AlkP superfamily [Halopenitus malekzadehii]
MTDSRPATIVFGLDGAHFELLNPWIKEGKLPNIKHAIESGVHGDLHSVLPPVTSPNWKAYATGKNPGKFGIFWWENIDVDERRVFYPQDRKNQQPEFWELLQEDDRPGVIGVPTTYPPKEVDPFLIAGAPDGANAGFAHPPELEQQLRDKYDYRVTIKNELRATPDVAAEEIIDAIDQRFTVARDLFYEYDLTFLQVTTFYINSLQHYFWDDEYTLRGWKVIDEHLGTFLDEGYDVILMSDHGSNAINWVFHVNTWLENENYLTLDTKAARFMHRIGINRDRLLRIISAFGLQDIAKRLAPQQLLNVIPDKSGELIHESKTSNVDWEHSTVLASGQGPVYLTVDENNEKYERIRKELITKLRKLTTPTGESVVRDVYRAEEVYSGSYVSDGPDLVLDQAPGIHIKGSIGRQTVFTEPRDDGWAAENKQEGLFAATGPSFDEGEVEPLSILDLAPTILHLRGYDLPRDLDGEVATEVFASDVAASEQPVSYREMNARISERERIRRIIRENQFE